MTYFYDILDQTGAALRDNLSTKSTELQKTANLAFGQKSGFKLLAETCLDRRHEHLVGGVVTELGLISKAHVTSLRANFQNLLKSGAGSRALWII